MNAKSFLDIFASTGAGSSFTRQRLRCRDFFDFVPVRCAILDAFFGVFYGFFERFGDSSLVGHADDRVDSLGRGLLLSRLERLEGGRGVSHRGRDLYGTERHANDDKNDRATKDGRWSFFRDDVKQRESAFLRFLRFVITRSYGPRHRRRRPSPFRLETRNTIAPKDDDGRDYKTRERTTTRETNPSALRRTRERRRRNAAHLLSHRRSKSRNARRTRRFFGRLWIALLYRVYRCALSFCSKRVRVK